MAKKGIKVRDLAHELGVTPRTLIDRCRQSGLSVQNSITRLSPDHVRAVRAWFAEPGRTGDEETKEQAF